MDISQERVYHREEEIQPLNSNEGVSEPVLTLPVTGLSHSLKDAGGESDTLMNGPASVSYSKDVPSWETSDRETESTNETPTGADSDESKKDADTSKAVTFAEDIEVYDLSHQASAPITMSLQTPVQLIDQHSNSVFSDHSEKQETGVDTIPSIQSKASDIVDQEVGKQTEEPVVEEQTSSSSAIRPAVLNLFKLDSAERSATEQTSENREDAGGDDERKNPQADDNPGHKEFTVESVDESELARDNESDKLLEKGTPVSDIHPLYERTLSPHSDGVSHSTDSNNQDTIGPLDNPAFLRTLQYSVSQPFDQDEQYCSQSNFDLRSVTAMQEEPDLDKGWAWVVLSASCVGAALLGATVYAAGILMSAILEEIDPDLTKAAWVGSVNVCAMCLSGPFVGNSLKRFGARVTVCIAGIVTTIGFVGASFSTSIIHLIITHGVIAGVGAGHIINPLFVTVGQYFNRYRGLACGILATGTGAGMLAGGATISLLLSVYGLSGTYLIWAGVMFHETAVGMLLRPSPEERFRAFEEEVTVQGSQQVLSSQPYLHSIHTSMLSGLNSWFGSVNHSMLSGMDKIGHVPGRRSAGLRTTGKTSGGESDGPLLKSILHREMSRSSHSVATNRSHPRSHITSPIQQVKHAANHSQGHGDPQGTSKPGSPANTPSASSPLTVPSMSQYTLSNNLSTSPYHHGNTHLSTTTLTAANATPNYPPSSPTSTRGSLAHGRLNRSRLLSTGSQSQYTSMSHISHRLSFRGSLHPSHAGEMDNESITSTLVSQLRPRDALAPRHPLGSRSITTFMGSIASFPTALAIVKDDLSRYEAFASQPTHEKSLINCGIKILDSLRLLRNIPFLIFIISSFLWAFGESPVMIYLPSYAMSKGTSQMQASSLYTSMGLGSIFGRFLSGLIATDSSIGPVILHTGCLGVAGLLVVISPFITATVVQQMIFSFLVGIYTGSLVPLASLIAIEMLGIGELGLGFGFICMAQGFGYLIGPPLSSVIVAEIGYEKSFVFSGVVLICGSIVAMSIACAIRRAEDEDEEEQHSLDDLEKALQRIADSDSEGAEEDSVSRFEEEKDSSVQNLSEGRDHQKDQPSDGNMTEANGVLPQSHERVPVEDERLDTIMEVVGK